MYINRKANFILPTIKYAEKATKDYLRHYALQFTTLLRKKTGHPV